jgi:hypothetical protein
MAAAKNREHPKRSAEPEKVSPAPSPKKPRSLRLLAVLAALAMLAGVVWLLPGIAAHTLLLQWGLKRATTDLSGTLTIESASLGWFSPIAVHGVELKDAEGKPLLTLAAASGDRSLASLLWDSSNLGHLRLDGPKLSLVLRDNGSNVEDLLAKYLVPQPAEAKSSPKIGLAVEIVDGTLAVTDQRSGQNWQVQKLMATVDILAGLDGPLSAEVSADLPDARRPGNLAASVKRTAGGGEAKLRTANVPLAMFRAIAARFAPGTTLTGQLSSDIRASWGSHDAAQNRVQGDVNLEAFSLGTPALQTDVAQIERLHAAWQAAWRPNRLEVERAAIDCDLGTASWSGTLERDEKGDWSLPAFMHQRQELSGRIDVARLARFLPATLRLRQHVEINSGQVQVGLSSRPAAQGMQWHAQFEAAHLTATAAGRQIAWELPMSLVVDAHETAGGPVVDSVQCESEFLKIHANGTPEALAAQWSFNLKQMSDQLGQFADLGAVQWSGEGWGNLNWKHAPRQPFDADAEIRLHNFQIAVPNQPPWHEDDLLALFSAKGQTDHATLARLDSASVKVKAGTEELDVRLVEPVQNLRAGDAWPIHVGAQGQLQDWPGRLAAWLPMKDCRLTGAYTLKADGTLSGDHVELRQATLTADPLIVASPRWNINEPRLEAAMAGSWNQSQRRLQIESASLACATMELQANHLILALPDNQPGELRGTLKYSGDAARIRRWFADPGKQPLWQFAAQFHGTAELHPVAGMLHGETTAEVSNLAVVDASGQQFQEPRIQLLARGNYQPQAHIMQLEQLELTSSMLTTNASGRIGPVSGVNNADVKGQINYDLERLAGLMRPWLGPGVHVTGRGSSPVWYRGPFTLGGGSAAAALKWDSADAFGLQLGRGALKAAMAEGAVRIEPLDLTVGQGRMHLAPAVRLVPDPIEITLPKGPLAERIQVTPELCAVLLKYIAPVLADVTASQGQFSVDLAGCRIPLGDLAKAEVAGRFTIHSMEVGPGPLVRQFAVFLGRETPAKLRPESTVLFRMVNGRVYHQGLELIFPEFSVRTHGSVGLDQTMNLMAEMPVPPKWLANAPMLAESFRNQTISVPIAGTLSQPRLDQRVMADLSRQFLQKAAGNMIQGGLNKQFERLFGPKK